MVSLYILLKIFINSSCRFNQTQQMSDRGGDNDGMCPFALLWIVSPAKTARTSAMLV